MGAWGEGVAIDDPVESLKVVATYSEEFDKAFPIPPDCGPFPLPLGYTCSCIVVSYWCAIISKEPCVPPSPGCLLVTVWIEADLAITIYDFYGVPVHTFDAVLDKYVTVEAHDIGTPDIFPQIITLGSTSCFISDGLSPRVNCHFQLEFEVLDSFDLIRGPDRIISEFTGTPHEAVRLCSVQVRVGKTFQPTSSGILTTAPAPPRTVTSVATCVATIYPDGIHIVEIGGVVLARFSATIWWVVGLDNSSMAVLWTAVTVQGDLGPSGQMKVIPASWTVPALTCTGVGIGPGGAYVTGVLQVGAMSCGVCENKSLKTALDPDDPHPVQDPIDCP